MSYFKAKMHEIRFRRWGELTVLFQVLYHDLRGLIIREREQKGREKKRRGMEWERGREGKEGEHPRFLPGLTPMPDALLYGA